MTELTVFQPVEPVGKCGGCDINLYPDMTHCSRPDCPLRGDHWREYQRMRGMQNTYIRKPE